MSRATLSLKRRLDVLTERIGPVSTISDDEFDRRFYRVIIRDPHFRDELDRGGRQADRNDEVRRLSSAELQRLALPYIVERETKLGLKLIEADREFVDVDLDGFYKRTLPGETSDNRGRTR